MFSSFNFFCSCCRGRERCTIYILLKNILNLIILFLIVYANSHKQKDKTIEPMRIYVRFQVHMKHNSKDKAFYYKTDVCYSDEVTHDIPYLYDYIDRETSLELI